MITFPVGSLRSFRLGGSTLLLAALCALCLSRQSATATVAASSRPGFQTSTQIDPSTAAIEPRMMGAGKGRATLPNDGAEAGILREAYVRLAIADHDYDGHRAKAMAQVSDAAKAFGVKLKGEGKGHEPQANSDDHLRAALGLLQQLAGGVAGQGLKHINSAIEQINIALKIR